VLPVHLQALKVKYVGAYLERLLRLADNATLREELALFPLAVGAAEGIAKADRPGGRMSHGRTDGRRHCRARPPMHGNTDGQMDGRTDGVTAVRTQLLTGTQCDHGMYTQTARRTDGSRVRRACTAWPRHEGRSGVDARAQDVVVAARVVWPN
jgi:hypothetical protein